MYDVGCEDDESEGGATMFDDERQKEIRRRTKRDLNEPIGAFKVAIIGTILHCIFVPI